MMELFLFWGTLFIFLNWFVRGLDLIIGTLFFLPVLPHDRWNQKDKTLPKISIIFAARNEEKDVACSLSSMVTQKYPNFEVIAVNDRSTDKTGDIMSRYKKFSHFKYVQIKDLPDGWLGKTHALEKGVESASGEWLLFTDADVQFAPDTLMSAVTAAEKNRLDHLTLMPKAVIKKFIELIFIDYFFTVFSLRFRPWLAQFQWSRTYAGIGAFNFISRKAYEKIGTHKALSLALDDDMRFGKLVKRNGYRQKVMDGQKFISVRWISGFQGVLKSLSKNAFAGINYNYVLFIMATVFLMAVDLAPFVFAFIFSGWVQFFCLGSLVMIFLIYLLWMKYEKKAVLAFPFYPLGSILFLYLLWVSVLRALFQGKVTWRHTSYPIHELRAYIKKQ